MLIIQTVDNSDFNNMLESSFFLWEVQYNGCISIHFSCEVDWWLVDPKTIEISVNLKSRQNENYSLRNQLTFKTKCPSLWEKILHNFSKLIADLFSTTIYMFWKLKQSVTSHPTSSPHLQIVMLSFLLGFQIQSSETPQVLLTHGLVHSCTSSDTLAVVVSRVRPPISFSFHVSEDHVLNWDRQTRYLKL